jgi:hypothetical protein
MKDLIKKMLRESFTESVNDLYIEGKKFYPKLKFLEVKDKYTGKVNLRAFTNYPKNKGSYSLGTFKTALTVFKISKTVEWLRKNKNINDVVYSKSTNSVYFNYKNKNFRLSDHKKNSFNGQSIIVQWYTTPQEIISYFN